MCSLSLFEFCDGGKLPRPVSLLYFVCNVLSVAHGPDLGMIMSPACTPALLPCSVKLFVLWLSMSLVCWDTIVRHRLTWLELGETHCELCPYRNCSVALLLLWDNGGLVMQVRFKALDMSENIMNFLCKGLWCCRVGVSMTECVVV